MIFYSRGVFSPARVLSLACFVAKLRLLPPLPVFCQAEDRSKIFICIYAQRVGLGAVRSKRRVREAVVKNYLGVL